MRKKGFIFLHRSILDHWIWLSDKHLKRWIYLIFQAAWEERTVEFAKKNVTIKRGQFITSIRHLMFRWNTNASTVQDFLKTLRKCGMISFKTYSDMTIITIVNYDKYQSEKFWEDFEVEEMLNHESDDEIQTQNLEPEKENPENTWERNREQKEINKRKKINKSSLSLREQEEKLFEQLKSSEIFIGDSAKNFGITKDDVCSWLEKFMQEMFTLEKWHNDFKDLRQHFYNWLRIQIDKQKQYGTPRKRTGGDGNAASPQDKYAARRGTDVGDKKASDYGGSF